MQKVAETTFEEANRRCIEDFMETLPSLSTRRLVKYRYRLGKISRDLGKPFDRVTREELRAYVEKVNNRPDLTDWTKQDYRIFVKKFFRWLQDDEFVHFIRIGRVKASVGVDDILSEVELEMIRRACDNPRDRALIETAYEGALRPHELLGLRKSDVAMDEYGAKVSVQKGKTGPRSVRVLNATPLLADWIANHPLSDKDAPLWVDMSNDTKYEPLHWLGLRKLVGRIAKRAGVEKRVNPYIFRHTMLTHLSKTLTEAQLEGFAGWEPGSDMSRNYVHLSGRDVDEAVLRSYGLIKPKEEKELRVPRKCARCGMLCDFDAEMCRNCGMPLTTRAVVKIEEERKATEKKLEDSNKRIDALVEGQRQILEAIANGAKVDRRLLGLRSEDIPPSVSD